MRELENTIESLVALSFEGEVDMSLIPTSAQTRPTPPLGLKERVEAYERGLIVEALRNADGTTVKPPASSRCRASPSTTSCENISSAQAGRRKGGSEVKA